MKNNSIINYEKINKEIIAAFNKKMFDGKAKHDFCIYHENENENILLCVDGCAGFVIYKKMFPFDLETLDFYKVTKSSTTPYKKLFPEESHLVNVSPTGAVFKITDGRELIEFGDHHENYIYIDKKNLEFFNLDSIDINFAARNPKSPLIIRDANYQNIGLVCPVNYQRS